MTKEYTYSPGLAAMARNAATYVVAEHPTNSGVVTLDSVFGMMAIPKMVDTAKTLFARWYADTVLWESAGVSVALTKVREETPLIVAAYLNEFANHVDRIVDVANILDEAAATIITYGHNRGGSGNIERGFCLLGSVDYVLYRREQAGLPNADAHTTFTAVMASVQKQSRVTTTDLVRWNDEPGRTSQDVIAFLKTTATAIRTVQP